MSTPPPDPHAEIAALRQRLAAEEERRRNRERELVEQTARTREAEARLDQVRQTMAFGLGQALVDALKPAGLMRLPARVIELRRRQQEKRGWQMAHAVEERPAHALRLVGPALARAADQGVSAAADWIEARPRAQRREKARALAELAIAEVERDAALAAAIGRRALALAADEARLAALATRLHEAGAVRAPRDLLAGIDDAVLTPALRRLRDDLTAAARLLAGGSVLPEPAAATGDGGAAILAARGLPWEGDLVAIRAARLAAQPGSQALTPDLLPAGCGAARIVVGEPDADLAALAAARRAGLSVTIDIGWLPAPLFEPEGRETQAAAAAWLRLMIGAAERVVARGAAFADVARDHGARDVAIEPDLPVVLPVLDDAERVALRRAFRVREGRRLILCPGSIDRDAGLAALVAAMPGDCFVLFCGTGTGMPGLVRAAAAQGHDDRVGFTGAIPSSQRLAAIALADAIALPRQAPAAYAADAEAGIAFAAGAGLPLVLADAAWTWRTCDPPADLRLFRFSDEAGLGAMLARALA